MIQARGTILKTSAEVMICTVNMVGVMGAGLAKGCADAYPGLLLKYRTALRKGWLKLGHPTLVDDPEWPNKVLLFATKDHYRDKSELWMITDGLDSLIERCQISGYTANGIAIPELGCGLGKLKWEIVKPEIIDRADKIEEIFKIIYLY